MALPREGFRLTAVLIPRLSLSHQPHENQPQYVGKKLPGDEITYAYVFDIHSPCVWREGLLPSSNMAEGSGAASVFTLRSC